MVEEEAGVQNNHSNKHSTISTQLDFMTDEERLTKARSVALADSDLSRVKGSSHPSLITLGVGLCFKKSTRGENQMICRSPQTKAAKISLREMLCLVSLKCSALEMEAHCQLMMLETENRKHQQSGEITITTRHASPRGNHLNSARSSRN